MIYSTATVPVNPEGASPLTRAQAWKGLVLKARDARLFLPPKLCTRCEVAEEGATHIVREATIAGDDLREIIAFELEKRSPSSRPQARAKVPSSTSFSRTMPARCNCGSIAALGLRGKKRFGPEEQAQQAQFDSETGYKAALLSTLRRTRELIAEGKL